MIDADVEKSANAFLDFWEGELESSEFFKLDFLWPSLSILDLFISYLWKREDMSSEYREILHQASSYVGVFLYYTLSEDKKLKIEVKNSLKHGVILSLENGTFLPDKFSSKIYLEKEILDFYSKGTEPFLVFRDFFKRTFGISTKPIALLTLGIITGLYKGWKGDFNSLSEKTLIPYISNVTQTLSIQTAIHYTSFFMEEGFGQIPELYMNGFIFPPLYMDESNPFKPSLLGVLKFVKEHKIKRKDLMTLGINLSRLADESISTIGLVISAALSKSRNFYINSSLSLRQPDVPSIRKGVILFREMLGISKDWLEEEREEVSIKLIKRERKLGLLPYIILEEEEILKLKKDELGREILHSLCEGDLLKAKSLLKKYKFKTDNDEMRMQRFFINLLLRFYNLNLEGPLSLDAETLEVKTKGVRYYYLEGLRSLTEENNLSLIYNMREAISLINESHWLYNVIRDILIETLNEEKRYEEVLEEVGRIRVSTSNITPSVLISEYKALSSLTRYIEAEIVRKEILELYPYNRLIFLNTIIANNF